MVEISRLVEDDVFAMTEKLMGHDRQLCKLCGGGLRDVAQNASGSKASPKGIRVAVIPVTSGLGIINGFCEAVSGIINFLGADSQITYNTDVRGLWEAVDQKYDIAFMADDHTFTAVNFSKKTASDNSEATGRGFAAALDMAAHGISGKRALVLGAGPVGISAVATLLHRGAAVTVFDIDNSKALQLVERLPTLNVADSLQKALSCADFVLDATPSDGFLSVGMLCGGTIVAAPGVPLGIEKESLGALKESLIHDVLEIGVATMLFDVL